MTQPDGEFLKQLIAAFREEAEEHLRLIEGGLIKVERTTDPQEKASLVETVFREAHSFKGAARAVNLGEIERVCQMIESVCASWKKGEREPDPEAFDGLHRSLDALRVAVAGLAQPSSTPAAGVETPATAGETVRMAVDKIERLLREAEELVAVKLTMGQRAVELSELVALFARWQAEWTRVQPEMRTLRQASEREGAHAHGDVARLTEFCEWNFAHVHAVELRMAALAATLRQDQHAVGRLVADLLDDSKKLMVLPFSTVTGVLPKLVRDLCREQGKEAEVVVRGDEIEVDKRILEEMKDPFVHLVRNCVGHGLEMPAERMRQGKPARGTIRVTVTEAEGRMVDIVVADDGAGIDIDRVREATVRCGVLTAEVAGKLDDDAVVAMTFQSDVSTSAEVTALSGRGLGLAIVREKVEKLSGRISIENRPGRGVTFRILLPLALATFRGILVEVAGQVFVIPASSVERVVRLKADDIRTVANRETVELGGQALSLARMEAVLELRRHLNPPDTLAAVVLTSEDKRVVFAVDAVLNESEVLVKPLNKPLVRVRNVAGATILGSGKVVPVLNVGDLIRSAATARIPAPPVAAAVERKRKTVLVVEDSITSRMLLKNILESAGYRVRTAVDGVDALTAMKTEAVDAVVSDIEMPRLNGFDLTGKIRADRKLAELPVVLVTALESAADRERGAEAGANAYIVKSSFDQSNLLEAIERLV